MKVSLRNGDISTVPAEEVAAYKKYIVDKYPTDIIDEIILEFDDEGFVNIETHKHAKPFNRIRRITGYLVGTLDRFNNGKRAEVEDRVKHGTEDPTGIY